MLKVVVQTESRRHEGFYSLLVRWGEDEIRRYYNLMIEISALVRLAMLWKSCHFYDRLVLVEPVIVHDKVQLRGVAV